MAISAGLNIALTGLESHQKAIDVTGNNISNASNPDYVRERAVFSTLPPINSVPGDMGEGVEISSINRLTDTFLYSRFIKANADLQNFKTQNEYLNEIATYFPDVQDQGLFKDIQDFFNAWQNLSAKNQLIFFNLAGRLNRKLLNKKLDKSNYNNLTKFYAINEFIKRSFKENLSNIKETILTTKPIPTNKITYKNLLKIGFENMKMHQEKIPIREITKKINYKLARTDLRVSLSKSTIANIIKSFKRF